MRCLACGAEMRLEQVARDATLSVPGFERQTFMCSACGDIEQRLAFTKRFAPSHTEPVPLHTAPSFAVKNEGAAAAGIVRRGFAKLCDAVGRRLNFSHTKTSRSAELLSVPVTPHTTAPPAEDVPALPFELVLVPKTPPTSLRPPEAVSAPRIKPSSVSPKSDNDFDECEALLRSAIEMVRGRTRSSQIRTSTTQATSGTRAELVSSMQVERSLTSRVIVQIHHDSRKGKYVAKDTKSGLSVLRHQDGARLRAMCDRMGWQIVDGAVTNATA
jgi:hypothetical protein